MSGEPDYVMEGRLEWLDALSHDRADIDAAEAGVPPVGNGSGTAEPVAFGHDTPTAGDDFFLEWPEFWSQDRSAAEWVIEDVLAHGRGHAFYAQAKKGKSLFLLWVALQLATGDEPVIVAYLDWEQTEDDLQQRISDMGYGPDSDLSRFSYALLPHLPPLDTADGGAELDWRLDQAQARHPDHHLVVVIDTLGRAVEGAENDADTFRRFYDHTGIRLKRRGCTYARLDHAGHENQRQRGSSSKSEDVDIVWALNTTDAGIDLRHGGVTRVSWAPERVSFRIDTEPVLTYERIAESWPAGTEEVAGLLAALEVPVTASGNEAQQALRDSPEGSKNRTVVLAAQKYRRGLAK